MVAFTGGCTQQQRDRWSDFDVLRSKPSGEITHVDDDLTPLVRVTDNPMDDDGEPMWQPIPTDVRVFPSTRFTLSDGLIVLEARIELLDAMGDAVKSPGMFDIVLEGSQHVGITSQDRTLYRWQVRIRTLDDQKRYYDPVTQTYLFNLKLRELAAPRRTVIVKVVFHAADGRMLDGELRIQGRG